MTVQSTSRGVSSATTGKGESGRSSESFNDQVPESPSLTDRAEMVEAVPGIGHSTTVTPSTRAGSTLPDFYDQMSPFFPDEEDEFVNQIVNGITHSDGSNSNLPPISNGKLSVQILIQHQHLQPCNQFQRIFLTPFQVVQI